MKRKGKLLGMVLIIFSIGIFCTSCSTKEAENESESTKLINSLYNKNKKNNKIDTNKENRQKSNEKDISSLLPLNPDFIVPEVLGQPSDKSIVLNIVPAKKIDYFVEWGSESSKYTQKTEVAFAEVSIPNEVILVNLQQNTRYYYRICYKEPSESTYKTTQENSFMTQRALGSTFTFCLQGDSHPERPSQFDPELYINTMNNVKSEKPDFYITMGDDFSVDTMKSITKNAVEKLFINQRRFLGIVGGSSPLFLVNGNHEQAAKYVLNNTPNNVAVWSQNARNAYFSEPSYDNFYTGNNENVEFIGKLRDYYEWTWGDAQFIVIDPYWHSDMPVDNVLKGGEKRSDMWEITIGNEQYQWLKKTLEESDSKYKFVFTHHILGTGRGGTDIANLYEWGGQNKNGIYEFSQKRPNWELPIHQLMAKNGVTIFFQGHDHIFVKQELDGVIYQSMPEPADPNYTLYNDNAYKSNAKYPNSGHVKVTVSLEEVKVEYVASFLKKDESENKLNGDIIYSYTVKRK